VNERSNVDFVKLLPERMNLLIDQDLLNRSVVSATTEVFTMMLDMEVSSTGDAAEAAPTEAGLVSIVGITGDWAGSGLFCCSPAFASVICSKMLGSPVDPGNDAIGEEGLDVVAEVTNMVIGNIKNSLEGVVGPLAISVPTVIHGRNFHFRNLAGLSGSATVFEADGDRFEVRVSLAPAQQASSRPRIPVFGLAHV
jgi:chemotaxis protein CheX